MVQINKVQHLYTFIHLGHEIMGQEVVGQAELNPS